MTLGWLLLMVGKAEKAAVAVYESTLLDYDL